jgi:hypothetical protein
MTWLSDRIDNLIKCYEKKMLRETFSNSGPKGYLKMEVKGA